MSTKPVSQSLQRRSSRSLPASVTAIVLLVIAGLAVWAAVAYLAAGEWPRFIVAAGEAAAGATWNDPWVWAGAIVALLAGLVLLLAAVLPGRHTAIRIPADSANGLTEVVISRRGLARLSAAHVGHTDGVESSSATATGKAVSVVVSTSLHEPGTLSRDIKDSLEGRFRDIGLNPLPRVSVRVRTAG